MDVGQSIIFSFFSSIHIVIFVFPMAVHVFLRIVKPTGNEAGNGREKFFGQCAGALFSFGSTICV
jgi:hypothetical protein